MDPDWVRLIRDFRDPAYPTGDTPGPETNPALVAFDILTNSIWKGLPPSDIDIAEGGSWWRWADYCDEEVQGSTARCHFQGPLLHEADEATQMLFDENQKLKKEIERLQKIISDGDADSDAREAENEWLRKVVDAAEALIQAQQKPGGRVPVTYYADFGRRIQTLRDALREPKKS